MNISIIIPLLDERDSLRDLYGELCAVASGNGYTIEMIFVDDGSADDSWSIVQELAAADTRVFGVRLRRNFGKAAAISAGTVVASFEYVVTIDADLQDDPHEIPKLFVQMEKGFDVVSGWKRDRKDPWSRRVASKGFNWLVNTLTKVKLHDHNCGFKLYRREVFDEVDLYGGFHRFVPVLAAARGFRIGEAVVNHRPRKHGKSKYGSRRIINGLLDLMTVCFLTGYSQRPQHLMGAAGLMSFSGGRRGSLLHGGVLVITDELLSGLDTVTSTTGRDIFSCGIVAGYPVINDGFPCRVNRCPGSEAWSSICGSGIGWWRRQAREFTCRFSSESRYNERRKNAASNRTTGMNRTEPE